MAPTTVRKTVISAYGDLSNIAVVESTVDAPAHGDVQVRVLYSGFSGADVNMRLGRYPMQRSAPLTPGYCFVGRVAANGAGCTKFAPGAAVTALTVYDSQTELINISEKYLIPVPDQLAGSDGGLQQVAAMTLDWTTAYGMVNGAANVQAGQRVFVHGLSGAVGYAAMILCQLRGAEVYGTASERNHEALRALGAKPFVYTDKGWMAAMQALGGAHAVFDPLGFESFDESYAILVRSCEAGGPKGTLVGYGNNKAALDGNNKSPWLPMAKMLGRNLSVWSGKRTTFFGINRDSKTFAPDMHALMELCAKGEIQVPIKAVWDLETEAIREAHESWGKMGGMGSLLIRITREA